MSGYGGTQLSERAQAAGVIDVLRKPLVRRDITESVARAPGAQRVELNSTRQSALRRRLTVADIHVQNDFCYAVDATSGEFSILFDC
jgi:FixJ family two-component response regulator